MADHPSPCARQRQSNDCELETLARLEGIGAAALPTPDLAARPGQFVARDRGGSRGVHSVRPLHSRLRRDSPQRCSRAARQRLHGGDRVRHQPADGQFVVRVVRRVHGVVPHRRAHQQERDENGAAGRAGGRRRTAAALLFPESLGNVSGAEQERRGAPALSQGRDRLPRRRVRLHGVLHRRRPGRSFSFDAHGAREHRQPQRTDSLAG